MKKYMQIFFVGILFCSFNNKLVAQSIAEEFNQLKIDDSVDMNTLALFPQNVRENIFKVSLHPQGVANIYDIQRKSNQSFKDLLATYPKEEQQKIWNLIRYNNLFSDLAKTKLNNIDIDAVLSKYPAEIYTDAQEYAMNHHDLIIAIDQINQKFNTNFQNIISNFPDDDQVAFRSILSTPDALSLLNKNMHLMMHLGNIYKTNPLFLRDKLNTLNVIITEENAKETENWKQEIQQDPEVEKELKQSAEQYAADNNYSEDEYQDTNPKIVEHYVYVPYPYWSGYPWWYDNDYWYPYPYWYHSGFYFWRGNLILLGPPSWFFIHWHFYHNHYHHFYHYPHITNLYFNHYKYGPRSGLSRNRNEVQTWLNRNENSLPNDFRKNNEQRINEIREFGKSEIDRDEFNKSNPGRNITRDDFIKQHAEKYPHLNRSGVKEPALNPRINVNTDKPKDNSNIRPVIEPRESNIDKSKSIPPQKERVNPIRVEPIESPKPIIQRPRPNPEIKMPRQEQPRIKQITPRNIPSNPPPPRQPQPNRKNSRIR